MHMNKEISEALGEQTESELHSSYLHLQMAKWFDKNGLTGFGGWMRDRAREKTRRALRVFRHLQERGPDVSPGKIEARRHSFISAREVVEMSLTREKEASDSVRRLKEMARKAEDNGTRVLPDEFSEFSEAQDDMGKMLAKLRLFSAAPAAMLAELDSQMRTDKKPDAEELHIPV